MYPRLFQFGHAAIPTYGVFTAIALIAALAVAMHFARRLDLNPEKIWNLGLLSILTALIGSRLLLITANFSIFRAHPLWVLGLTTVRNHWVFTGGVILGIAAALLYVLAEGLPLLRVLDCASPALALALCIHGIGAFCAGLAYGVPASLPWGVTYNSRIAALWYGTPLGIKLHPVQMYDAVASLVIFLLLVWWLPRRRQDGELAGAWFFLYGLCSFFLGFYRGDTAGREVLGGAFTSTQVFGALAVFIGGTLWLQRSYTSGNATNPD